jgi:hypothetical protein
MYFVKGRHVRRVGHTTPCLPCVGYARLAIPQRVPPIFIAPNLPTLRRLRIALYFYISSRYCSRAFSNHVSQPLRHHLYRDCHNIFLKNMMENMLNLRTQQYSPIATVSCQLYYAMGVHLRHGYQVLTEMRLQYMSVRNAAQTGCGICRMLCDHFSADKSNGPREELKLGYSVNWWRGANIPNVPIISGNLSFRYRAICTDEENSIRICLLWAEGVSRPCLCGGGL